MLGILGTLALLMERNHTAFSVLPAATGSAEKLRRFFIRVPILVYLGWISVATIANITALRVKAGWDGFGLDPVVWTIIVIAAGAVAVLVASGVRLDMKARQGLASPHGMNHPGQAAPGPLLSICS